MAAYMCLSLVSQRGDRLGHLVRGVQMLMSYGRECRIRRVSSIYVAEPGPDVAPRLLAVVAAETDLAPLGVLALCREVEWALGQGEGQETGALAVDVVWYGAGGGHGLQGPAAPIQVGDPALDAALAELAGKQAWAGAGTGDARQYLDAAAFRRLCQPGQRDGAAGARVMGEAPGLDG